MLQLKDKITTEKSKNHNIKQLPPIFSWNNRFKFISYNWENFFYLAIENHAKI